MADYRIDKVKESNNKYYLLDSGATHTAAGLLSGTASGFKSLGTIAADKGIFNKLIATEATIENLDVNNLSAVNATVVGLLDVQGELHTNSWTNANIANIGGSFYISPTVEATDTTNYPAKISITKNTSSWTISITGKFATDFIKSGTATSGVTWPANSLVLITGDVVLGKTKYPLGTLKGTLGSNVTATAASTSKTITLNSVTDAQNSSSPSVLLELYQANNNANISSASLINGKISLYSLRSGSSDYKIGILLSSMGVSSNSIIDIYGGVQADPVVRIGHLAGLPSFTVGTKTTVAPTGWGIYTDNGYFKGTVASTSGIIGGWTIGASSIYNGTSSKTSTTAGTYLGTDAIRNYQTSSQYVHIENGKITAKGVEVTGNITATSGTIGGCVIENGLLKVPAAQIINLEVETITGGTRGNPNYIYVSVNDSGSFSINSISKTDWRVILGNTFGIDKSGYVTASTGKIGGWKLNANSFSVDKDFIIDNVPTTTYDYIVFSNGELSSSKKVLDRDSTDWNMVIGNSFGITSGGSLYSSSATIAEGVLGPFSLDENGLSYEKNQTYQMFNNYPSGTYNGITFRQSGRQVILYGTATANTSLYCRGQTTGAAVPVADFGANTSWTFGGSPEGGSTTTYRTVGCFTANGTTPSGDGTVFYEYGSGGSAEGYRYATLKIYLRSGQTYGTEQNPLVFTPYLKDATGKDYLENFLIVASTDSFSFGENSFVKLSANGEASIGKEGLGDYLKYTLTGYNGNITFKATSIDSIGGTFTNLVTNNLTATSIALGEQDLSTRLTNLGGGINAVQASVNSLSANLSTNYYTKANIEAIQSTINNTITQNIGVVTQSINQINSTIESMQNTFGVNVEFYFAKNSVKKWQMRLGKEVVTGKPNLNDIWVE